MKTITIAATLLLAASSIIPSFACTTIIVGKDASTDGSIIISRNNDTEDPHTPNVLFRHPELKDNFQFQSNENKFVCTMPIGSLSYTAMPDATTIGKHNPSYEETGINEYGVALSATETIFNSDSALKADGLVENGVTEDMITSVVLPQATSAKEGVRILGSLVEKVGNSEGFGVAFSDRNEAWYLESASGHHWLAMRIPDNMYFISANQGRFQETDINDSMNVLSSPGLVDFAAKNKLFDPEKEKFNFFKCYVRNIPHDETYDYPRVRELLKMYSGFNYDKNDALYPVFMEPTKKMSVWDVAAGLRNHYNGTANDPYQTQNPKEINRPISVLRASFSHITQVKPNLPGDIATAQYICLGMTDLSAYVPFYKGLGDVPKAYSTSSVTPDDSMFWKVRKVQALVFQNYPKYAPMVHEAIAKFEKDIARKQLRMEKKYVKIYQQDPEAAKQLIQSFTNDIVEEQGKIFTELAKKISKDLGKENLTNDQYLEMINKAEETYHFPGA
ncbi:MAG: C69 family dipeptidase [Lentisphaerota bacterium]